jgi:hypothetical protein
VFPTVAVLQAIFNEFNTLSVVYQQPAALFVQSAQYQLHEDELEQEQVAPKSSPAQDSLVDCTGST